MAATTLIIKDLEVDLSTGAFNAGGGEEGPRRFWQFMGDIEYDPSTGTQSITTGPKGAIGACPFPLAALTPVLIHGAAKWFDVALGQLVDGAAIEITRRLDLLVGDDFNAVANAVIAKSTIRRSTGGDFIELETDIGVPSKSVRPSMALSGEEVALFTSVSKVNDFTETILHSIAGKKHKLEGDAFVWFETEEGRKIKGKMTSTWAYEAPEESKNQELIYCIHHQVAFEHRDYGENLVMAKSSAETIYSSLD